MTPQQQALQASLRFQTRRHLLGSAGIGLGAIALGALSGPSSAAGGGQRDARTHAATAKNVIYLHMAGSPPQHESFDHKPVLARHDGEECPQELIEGRDFAFIKGVPKLLGPRAKFARHGQSGIEVSEHFPHLAERVDDLCLVRSMTTDQFNHAPAQLLLHTGSPQFGGASIGSWATYGLGSENRDLPGYVVLTSGTAVCMRKASSYCSMRVSVSGSRVDSYSRRLMALSASSERRRTDRLMPGGSLTNRIGSPLLRHCTP